MNLIAAAAILLASIPHQGPKVTFSVVLPYCKQTVITNVQNPSYLAAYYLLGEGLITGEEFLKTFEKGSPNDRQVAEKVLQACSTEV